MTKVKFCFTANTVQIIWFGYDFNILCCFASIFIFIIPIFVIILLLNVHAIFCLFCRIPILNIFFAHVPFSSSLCACLACLFACLLVCLSVFLSVRLFVFFCVSLYISLSLCYEQFVLVFCVCLFVCLHTCPIFSMSCCLPVAVIWTVCPCFSWPLYGLLAEWFVSLSVCMFVALSLCRILSFLRRYMDTDSLSLFSSSPYAVF